MSLVWDNFSRGGSEKLIMLAMADWSNDAGSHCYPSVKKVSEKCNVSECQARRILHKLIGEGYLSVVGNESGGGNNSRQYQVNVSAISPSTHASPITGASPSTHARVALAPMHVSPSTHASLSVNNHQLSVSNKHRPKKLDFTSWPSLPNDQTLTDWLAMRKRLKANVTQTVINRLGKKLHAACSAGYTVDDCISECVMRNWKGFDVEWMKKDKRKDRIQRDGFEHNDYNDGLEVFQ